jgi:2-dehydro-3-deoxyphosphogluconate aldolase/(4S)-4-hydroxy-2-oxoglutarate aldolase
MNLLHHLRETRIVPVIDIASVPDAVPVAQALFAAGLPSAEITFRTAAAADAIKAIATEVPGLVVGAGTVRTVDQVDQAVDAGAKFLVAPGLNPAVISRAELLGVPMLPGVCTPTEIEQALGMGLSLLKFFPAEAAGGAAYLGALAGPYRDVLFVPTGGIGPDNIAAYLAKPNVVACGGSWMVNRDLIAARDFAAITRLTAEALRIVDDAKQVSAR